MEHPDYSLEQLSADNLHDLYRLFKSVYGKKQHPGFFHRKYDTAYTGHSYIGYFAYSRDRTPIAFYGVIPCFLRGGGKRILAAQSTDTMTHPDYRLKGVFMKLAERCFQLCQDHGILLLFGFPNQNSYHGFLKLGWTMTGTMDFFSLQVVKVSWKNLSSKFSLTRIAYKWYCKRVLNKYILPERGIGNRLIKEGFTGIDRDESYLRYKTYSETLVLGISQSKVWVEIKYGLAIGDIELGTNEDFDAVIQLLLQLCRKLGLKEINFHTSPGTLLHRLFTNHYSSKPSFPIILLGLDPDYSLDNIKFTLADIDIF